MGYDHAICPNCAFIWQFDGLVDAGEIVHCDHCANDFRAGRWCGKCYPNYFASLFRSPVCPQCKSTNSTRGVQVGFYRMNLYLRQCKDCSATWVARK